MASKTINQFPLDTRLPVMSLDDLLVQLSLIRMPDGSLRRRDVTLRWLVELVADEIESRQAKRDA